MHLEQLKLLIGNNRQLDILLYIIGNVNEDNIFIGTIRAIAKATKISTRTVNTTINKLIDANLITLKQIGVYEVNPILLTGGNFRRRRLVIEY